MAEAKTTETKPTPTVGESLPPDPSLSRDAQHSTYTEASRPKEADDFPPPGRTVEQELGTPTEAT